MTEPSGVYPTAPLPRYHTRPAGFVGSVAAANPVSYNIQNLSMSMSELTGFHHPTYRIYTKDALNSSKGLKTTVTVCSDGVPFDFVQQNLRIKFWLRFGRTPLPLPEPAEPVTKAIRSSIPIVQARSDNSIIALPSAPEPQVSTDPFDCRRHQHAKRGNLLVSHFVLSSANSTPSQSPPHSSPASSGSSTPLTSAQTLSSAAPVTMPSVSYETVVTPLCLSDGGTESTVRLRAAIFSPDDAVVLAYCDSESFVIMSRNLPSRDRLVTYLPQWGWSRECEHEEHVNSEPQAKKARIGGKGAESIAVTTTNHNADAVAAMLAIGGHAKPGSVGAEEVSPWPLEFDDEQFATNTHLILPCGRLVPTIGSLLNGWAFARSAFVARLLNVDSTGQPEPRSETAAQHSAGGGNAASPPQIQHRFSSNSSNSSNHQHDASHSSNPPTPPIGPRPPLSESDSGSEFGCDSSPITAAAAQSLDTRVGPTVQILLHLLQLQQNQAAANALIAEQSAKSIQPFAQNALNNEPHQQTVKLIQLLLLSQQQQQLQQSMLS